MSTYLRERNTVIEPTDTISFDSALDEWDQDASGAVAAGVLRGDAVLFRGTVGCANIEHRLRATAETRFQIASLSKQFLGALALYLADQGIVELDGDARALSPLLRQYPDPITLRHLLSHTSGIMDTFDILSFGGAKVETPIGMAALFALLADQRHLNFKTGEGFAYSNAGFEIAASIVEAATDRPLSELYETHIFHPAGMARTLLVNRDDTVVDGAASGYLVLDGEARHATHGVSLNGAAGVRSTLEDLMTWEAHLHKDGSGIGLLARLETPPQFSSGAPGIYGLGTYVDRRRDIALSGHGGLLPGFVASVVRSSAEKVSAVVLANRSDVDANRLARRLLGLALSRPIDAPGDEMPIMVPGRYYDPARHEHYEVALVDGKPQALSHGWTVPFILGADGEAVLDDPLLDGRFAKAPHRTMTEWGRSWPLRRLDPPRKKGADLDRFVGVYAGSGIPGRLHFSASSGELRLEIDGDFGRCSYRLERLDDGIFLGRSAPGLWMPFEMLIAFFGLEGPGASIRITTDRTKDLVLHRMAQ